jgi:hypothetical protein
LTESQVRHDILHVRIARTILALLIAASVAMLPAAAGAGPKVKSTETAEMSVSEPMDDCCPHPCDKAVDDCLSMAACVCFGFATASFSQLVYPSAPASVMPAFASGVFHSQTGHPPFRPPRV